MNILLNPAFVHDLTSRVWKSDKCARSGYVSHTASYGELHFFGVGNCIVRVDYCGDLFVNDRRVHPSDCADRVIQVLAGDE